MDDLVGSKIVALEGGKTKDQMAENLRTLRAGVALLIEHVQLMAQVQRAKYLALVKEGFTEAQALELTK